MILSARRMARLMPYRAADFKDVFSTASSLRLCCVGNTFGDFKYCLQMCAQQIPCWVSKILKEVLRHRCTFQII